MSVMRLTGSDTIKINQRLITDLPHAEVCKISYESDLVTVKTGKNKNAIFAKNESGNQATMELKVLRGSGDDKFLNGLRADYEKDPAAFTLMTGELVKRVGDGAGNINSDIYVLSGGVIAKNQEVTSNCEGDVEQAIAIYSIKFAFAPRTIV